MKCSPWRIIKRAPGAVFFLLVWPFVMLRDWLICGPLRRENERLREYLKDSNANFWRLATIAYGEEVVAKFKTQNE